MFKLNLQTFAEAVQGKKIVYLYRLHKEAASTDGATLAFTTENSISIEKDADSTATKDGSIRTPGQAELEVTATSVFKKGDEAIEKYEDAMINGDLFDIWRANLEAPGTGENKYKGRYYQGYMTSFEETSNAEDFVEYSLTFGINGSGAKGDVTVTVEQQDAANYDFADTPATHEEESE